MRLRYRCGQALGRARALLGPPDVSLAGAVLSEEAFALFSEMPWADQRHGLCVLRRVGETGDCPSELAQAALLHDVGKSGINLGLVPRTLFVLLEAVDRGLVERLGGDGATKWCRPFYVQAHHAEIGARRCKDVGCPPMTVDLVRYHESPEGCPEDRPVLQRWLAALREADDRC